MLGRDFGSSWEVIDSNGAHFDPELGTEADSSDHAIQKSITDICDKSVMTAECLRLRAFTYVLSLNWLAARVGKS